MKKIKVEELGCFNEVASVIGVVGAKKELFRVASVGCIDHPDLILSGAFNWALSPQGHKFWSDMNYVLSNQP